jgi:undecaprenyl-diphosphatase
MPFLQALDIRLLHAIYGANGPAWLTDLMIGTAMISKGSVMYIVSPLLAWLKSFKDAVAVAVSLGACALCDWGLKLFFSRDRPCVCLADIHSLLGHPTDASFPSGHALRAFAVAACLASSPWVCAPGQRSWKRRLVTITYVFAALVCVSRIYLGAHFPSDVLAGALVGTLLGILGERVTKKYIVPHKARASQSPSAHAPAE